MARLIGYGWAMSLTLQFIVMLTPIASEERVVEGLVERLPDAVQIKRNSLRYKDNHLELWANRDADPNMIAEATDGWLYFDARLEVTPLGPKACEDDQVALARELLKHLREMDLRCVLCANFEDRFSFREGVDF